MITFSINFQEHPGGSLSVFTHVLRSNETEKESEHAALFAREFNAWFEKFAHEQLRQTGGHTISLAEDQQHIITERIARLGQPKR